MRQTKTFRKIESLDRGKEEVENGFCVLGTCSFKERPSQ